MQRECPAGRQILAETSCSVLLFPCIDPSLAASANMLRWPLYHDVGRFSADYYGPYTPCLVDKGHDETLQFNQNAPLASSLHPL